MACGADLLCSAGMFLEVGDERPASRAVRHRLPCRILVSAPPHQVVQAATHPTACHDGLHHVVVCALAPDLARGGLRAGTSCVALATPPLPAFAPAFGGGGAFAIVQLFLPFFITFTSTFMPDPVGDGLLLAREGSPARWRPPRPAGRHCGAELAGQLASSSQQAQPAAAASSRQLLPAAAARTGPQQQYV